MDLLIVAGEASGDRAAAAVLAHLKGIEAFGLGGPALEASGLRLVADIRSCTALGVGEAAARAGAVLRAWRRVVRAVRVERPRAALLVNYTEFNARLASKLHRSGMRVLWYGAPQVWAWRAGRVESLRRSVDRMAVVLPFEEALWQRAGVDAHYVGHPALEAVRLDRGAARRVLGMTSLAAAIAILPGSRPHEVRRLLPAMLHAYERVCADRASVDARVLVASSLDASTRHWLSARCAAQRVATFDVDPCAGAITVLPAFDAALCASGTASLEAALARAVPVVAYRVGLATELTGRALIRTPHVGLPNVLLKRRVFAELLQRDVCADRLAAAVTEAIDRRPSLLQACDEVERILRGGRLATASLFQVDSPVASFPPPVASLGDRQTPTSSSTAVARMLLPWLSGRACAA